MYYTARVDVFHGLEYGPHKFGRITERVRWFTMVDSLMLDTHAS